MRRIAIAVSLTAMQAFGQCSLCRFAVAQDASLGTAFNKAIIVLMIPALGVFAGVFLLAVRSSRNKNGK